jgi:hypothetical protein
MGNRRGFKDRIYQEKRPPVILVKKILFAKYSCIFVQNIKVMHCENINISRHALNKALERNIELKDAFEVVKSGIVITQYLDTKPHP